MTKAKAWIKAMRLRTLPLSFSCILTGSGIAYYENMMDCVGGMWNWNVFILTLLTTLFLQILSNLANDYGDAKKGADNENRIGPERAVQSGLISLKEMKNGVAVFALLSFVSGVFLLLEAFDYDLNWVFLGFITLGLAAIAAAIKYTVGKGAYGYSGMGDIFVIIFFGLVGVMGTTYLQAHYLNELWALPALTIGLLSAAVLNLNNMRDRVNDQEVGKNTLAVKFGFKGAKAYHLSLFLAAYAFLFGYLYLEDRGQLALWSLAVVAIHIIHLIKVFQIKEEVKFDPHLKIVALSTFLLSLIFFILSYLQL